ncbi:MAG TPA: hypothetical protein VHY35_24375 [Stellaceae bacterium]|nr:hypothetical protein [Stellaceae bacterium]
MSDDFGSPWIDPRDLVGKTAAEIDQAARDRGLIAKGPDPMSGHGSYIDPVTGEQRILLHSAEGHFHLNNSAGERLDIEGRVVLPEAAAAHLWLRPR